MIEGPLYLDLTANLEYFHKWIFSTAFTGSGVVLSLREKMHLRTK